MNPQSSLQISETDVLIVGAGPSGLMVAQALARLGVKTRVIDRRIKGSIYGNADGLQPRTLEVFESYGIIHETLERSARLNALVIYKAEESGIVRQPPGVNVKVKSRYPYEATCSIRTIEGVLARSASRHGLEIEYELQPSSAILSQDPAVLKDPHSHAVKVVLESAATSPGGIVAKEIVKAKFLLGADGANSWVRENFQIPMEGEKTQFIWGVIEGVFKTDFPDFRCKCILQHPFGAIIFIPREDNITRIYVQLSETDVVRTPDGRIDMTPARKKANEVKVADRISRILKPYQIDFGTIEWSTVFAVAQMVAGKYTIDNRVFMLGDACHRHSPNAGQGANASMADGHNLAWKLAHVLRGWASTRLLDTYESERRTYAQGLIEFDKALAQMMNSGNAFQYAEMSNQQNLNTSGIGLHYNSSLSHSFALPTDLKPGTRLPPSPITRLADWQAMDLQDLAPSNGLWKLILFSDPKRDLSDIAEELFQSANSVVQERLQVNVILDVKAEKALWREVPPLLRKWERVFSGTPAPELLSINSSSIGTVFAEYKINSTNGILLLVRPDGHMSLIDRLTPQGISLVFSFLKHL